MRFAHNGLHDQLTRLAAPPHYYEILRREIALANRNLTELTSIRIILTSSAPLYAATIVSFADLITNSFRYEDAKARLGENEFALLIRGDQELATDLSRRLVAQWAIEGSADSTISYACAKYSSKELAIDFLNRLDDEALTSTDF